MRITTYKTLLNDEKHCEIVKEKSVNYDDGGNAKFNNSNKIYHMLCDVFQHDKQTEEYVYMLCLDAKCKLTGVFELSHGSVNMTLCSTREIFQKALLCNATHIVLAHNHPSGEATPSKEDVGTYRRVKNAGEILGIDLIDNLIIGDREYCSFAEMGFK